MSSLLAANGVALLGARSPRVRSVPPRIDTAGPDAVAYARLAGLVLDPWQADAVGDILAEGPDQRWAARRTYVTVPRQNGKGALIEAIELYGLFILHETILHSAHLFDTAREAFLRIRALIEQTPDLLSRVKRINEAHGKEGIELQRREPTYDDATGRLIDPGGPGGRLHFHARTKGGGRGKSPQRVILDEGFALTRDQMAALLPALSAQDDPQVNVFTTPPPHGEPCEVILDARAKVLAAQKEGRPAEVCWLEWGLERGADITLPSNWAIANPAYGIRITERTCRDELDALEPEEFGVERCGIWPLMGDAQWAVIPEAEWNEAADQAERGEARPVFGVDMSPDRTWAAIVACWKRPDGLKQLHIVDLREGVGWVMGRFRELDQHRPAAWVVSHTSPASSLVPDMNEHLKGSDELLIDSGRAVVRMNAPEAIAGAGMLYDGIAGKLTDGEPTPRTVRHSGQPQLAAAVAAAMKNPPEDKAWAWDRTRPHSYLLYAATAALWGLAVHGNTEEVVLEGSLGA
jgi:hypothetical protein